MEFRPSDFCTPNQLIAHLRPGLVATRCMIAKHQKANVGTFNCYILQCTTFVQIVRQFYTHLLPGKSLAWFHESTARTATSQSLMETKKKDHTVTTPSQEHEQHQDHGRGSQFPCGTAAKIHGASTLSIRYNSQKNTHMMDPYRRQLGVLVIGGLFVFAWFITGGGSSI